jgi:hypothetical protein
MSLIAAAAMLFQTTCSTYYVTGYVADEFPGYTADGSTTTLSALARGEHIVAASYNLPFDTIITIEELPYAYRVADRGHLGARHIDVLVSTRAEAYALTSYREVCTLDTD